jgi:hypothetical protein
MILLSAFRCAELSQSDVGPGVAQDWIGVFPASLEVVNQLRLGAWSNYQAPGSAQDRMASGAPADVPDSRPCDERSDS